MERNLKDIYELISSEISKMNASSEIRRDDADNPSRTVKLTICWRSLKIFLNVAAVFLQIILTTRSSNNLIFAILLFMWMLTNNTIVGRLHTSLATASLHSMDIVGYAGGGSVLSSPSKEAHGKFGKKITHSNCY